MARSHRHKPIWGHTTCPSEKSDKQLWHRRFRRAVRQLPDLDEETLHANLHRQYSNPWSMGKDGKSGWQHDPRPEWLRK